MSRKFIPLKEMQAKKNISNPARKTRWQAAIKRGYRAARNAPKCQRCGTHKCRTNIRLWCNDIGRLLIWTGGWMCPACRRAELERKE